MKNKSRLVISALGLTIMSSCSQSTPHNGRLPFRLMEKPPSERSANKKLSRAEVGDIQKMKELITHHAVNNKSELQQNKGQIKNGDIVAFYMSHKEAGAYLRKGNIQKVPYELFRYGHLAIVVPDPVNPKKHRLLQIAMSQAANIEDNLSYLDDKNWVVYRPPSVDVAKLAEFTKATIAKCSSFRKAYDYSGAFGITNVKHKPNSESEIASEYTCCTLVVSALYYSGYELHATSRAGALDIITPRQVVESWGVVRNCRSLTSSDRGLFTLSK